MSAVRRLVRDKKGMSDVFAALFFVILILLGFNAMVWTFTQFDSYNTVLTNLSQQTQQASSESLKPTAPGATGFAGTSFSIIVNNTGTVLASVVRIYIFNVSPAGSSQCQGVGPCVIDSSSPVNCAGNGLCTLANGNIRPGEVDHFLVVTGLTINDGSGYRVVLATSRGRQFSFFYPWPATGPSLTGPSNSNTTNTDHGPIDVQIAQNTFNFTMDSWTQSQPAWVVPYKQNLVFYLKITNNAQYPITLNQYSNIYTICNPGADCEDTQTYFIVDNSTINPSNIVAYNQATRPVVLPPAGPDGPTGYTIVKFAAFTPSGNSPVALVESTPYLFWIIFFFTINGQVVGQSLDYVTLRACATYPSC